MAKSKYPQGDEYFQALQVPHLSFYDLELKNSEVEQDIMGPRPRSGNYANIYHLFNQEKAWAVRCFTKDVAQLQERYQAIGNFIINNPHEALVNATCLMQGIKVNSEVYPIIKMDWIEGSSLSDYISNCVKNNNLDAISYLIASFRKTIFFLEKHNVAHGDLQTENILVTSSQKLHLVDYDGFYIPELKNLKSTEIGHSNFQHPNIPDDGSYYDAKMDRFPAIVIFLGLSAVIQNNILWNKYNSGDNILFKRKDFNNLQNSKLFAELDSIPDFKFNRLVQKFKIICESDFDNVPSLEQFIEPIVNVPVKSTTANHYQATVSNKAQLPRKKVSQLQGTYPILNFMQTQLLRERVGQKIELLGYITDINKGQTKKGLPYIKLYMIYNRKKLFTLVFWSEALTKFEEAKILPGSYVDRVVSVTGIVHLFNDDLQIVIESPLQIEILSDESFQDKLKKASKSEKYEKQQTNSHSSKINNIVEKTEVIPSNTLRKLSSPKTSFSTTIGGVSDKEAQELNKIWGAASLKSTSDQISSTKNAVNINKTQVTTSNSSYTASSNTLNNSSANTKSSKQNDNAEISSWVAQLKKAFGQKD